MNQLIFRSSHETSFHTYNLLNLITLHKNQIHIPIDWQWYDNHHQQVLGGWEVKNTALTLLGDRGQTLLKCSLISNNIDCLCPCWSLCLLDSFLLPYIILLVSYIFCIFYYPYVQHDELLDIPELNTFLCLLEE